MTYYDLNNLMSYRFVIMKESHTKPNNRNVRIKAIS